MPTRATAFSWALLSRQELGNRERSVDKGAMGAQLVNWQRVLERNWSNLRFGEVKVTSDGGKHVFEVQAYLNGLNPDAVRVELYADGKKGGDPVRHEMTRGKPLVGVENGHACGAEMPATRPATDYTARVIPHRPGLAVPLEAARILWQR